jgi:molecular chaperone DnaK
MDGPNPDNRRRHNRTKVALLVQYRFDTFDDFITEYSVDLSPGGIFIRTDTPPELGTVVHLQFSLRDGSHLIEGLGKVVRIRSAGPEGEAGMGIEFTQFDPDALALVERICGQRDR